MAALMKWSDRVRRDLRARMRATGVNQRELGKRMGVSEARISQMLMPGANLTLETVDWILEALPDPHPTRIPE